jgi:hypothetical protein
MQWVAVAGIVLTGAGVVWEGVKGLRPPAPGKTPTPRGTAYATIVAGVAIMVAGVVVPLVWF